jgi:hypothetical protein
MDFHADHDLPLAAVALQELRFFCLRIRLCHGALLSFQRRGQQRTSASILPIFARAHKGLNSFSPDQEPSRNHRFGQTFLGDKEKEDLMPRVDEYRNNHLSDYDSQTSTSGALLFAGIVAAVILAAFLWAAYVPQSEVQPGAMNTPSMNTPATPQPRTPAAPATPSQPGGPAR